MSAAASTDLRWRRVEKFPGHPDHDEFVLGERVDYRGLVVTIRPFESLGVRTWTLNLDGCGSPTIQYIASLERAQELGAYLYDALLPDVQAHDAVLDARVTGELARADAERPTREAEARKLAAAVAAAPAVTAFRCEECHDLFIEPQDAPVYECSRCGGHSHERRCEDCNIFAAKVADVSCPHCEAAFDRSDASTVQAALVDGHLHEKGQA